MSTHGPQFDEFKAHSGEQHGGAEYDEGFRPAEGSDPLNEQTGSRPRVSKHGSHWDEFPWRDMPGKHGQLFDSDFGTKTAMDGAHGTWHDVFRDAKVKFIKGGRDMEGIVLNTESDHAVVETSDGTRHEIGLGQITGIKNVPGSNATPNRQEASRGNGAAPGADAARSGAQTTEHGSGPLPAAPSHGPSSSANAGHLRKSDAETVDVAKATHLYSHGEGLPKSCADCGGKLSPVGISAAAGGKASMANRGGQPAATCDKCGSYHGVSGMAAAKSDTEILDVLKALAEGGDPAPLGGEADVAKAFADTYGEAHAAAVKHSTAALKAAKAGDHDAAWTHHDRAMSWHAKAHMMKTQAGVESQLRRVGKTVDSSETAAQAQDLENKTTVVDTGKHWCPNCKHFCRHGADGKCPTCGGKTTVKKDEATDADVLKTLTTLAQEG